MHKLRNIYTYDSQVRFKASILLDKLTWSEKF